MTGNTIDGGGNGGVVWVDGGVATELRHAGLPMRPPWWTTLSLNSEPRRAMLREVHARHLRAGARVITANTFRCNLRALRRIGLDDAGNAWMVHAAVGVAQAARRGEAGRGAEAAWVAGAMAPVEDCYRPDLVPPDDELRTEHRWLATELMRAGVDLFLIETMNTGREARIALEQALEAGGRAWVSFVCAEHGRLPSGERLADAAAAVERDGAEAVLVNCTPPGDAEIALGELREACGGRIGVYPNIEDRGAAGRWSPVDADLPAALSPAEFADLMSGWRERFGPEILGGCCGVSAEHLSAARDRHVKAGT